MLHKKTLSGPDNLRAIFGSAMPSDYVASLHLVVFSVYENISGVE